MRLIDADALMKDVCGLKCGCMPDECWYDFNGDKYCEAAQYIEYAPTIDPIEWLKSWIGEIMLNTDNEPIEPSEIIRRIDEGGLKRFIEDYERERKDE